MAKLQYQCTMSLDGFITGAGGDMSWLAEFLSPNPEVEDLIPEVGTLLVGNRTFRGDDPNKGNEHEGEPYGGGWRGPQVVLTHHISENTIPDITFVSDLNTAVATAKAAAGDKYVAVLGADIARQCIQAGLMDEIFVCIAPVLLGDGVRLFDVQGGADVRLELLKLTKASSVTSMLFRVLR
jgi:dihydrofolate reductase